MQLAIDTSTSIASIALANKGEVMAELTWHTERNHSVELLPNLNYLLRQAKIDLQAIDGVIVAKGPGSYNGLRVGLSTAKGLAFALEVPLVGIGTLEVEASPHALAGLPICAMQSAGGGEVAAAIYQWQAGRWIQSIAEHLTTLEVLSCQISARTLFCGEISPEMATHLRQGLGDKAVIPPEVARLRRAGYLAELGWRRLEQGMVDDIATLQPIYLRRPPITQPRSPLSVTTLLPGRQDG